MERKDIEALVAAAIMRAPMPIVRAVNSTPTSVDGRVLEPRTQFLLGLQVRSGRPGLGEMDVEQTREAFGSMTTGLGPGARALARVVDRRIDGPAGDIPVRVYSPSATPKAEPALVYYHGGGWVIGNPDTHDEVCRALAETAECVVVSVDYRLAPEHRFPAAVDDALAAFRWVRDHADELGIDARRIALGGDSAGGNLSAVVAQLTKGDAIPPCFQMLVYPVVDLRCDSGSYDSFAEGFFLTRDAMHWFRDKYLDNEAQREDPRASPLLSDDVSGVAPAFIATAGFDPLRDEGRAYAEKLAAAGVVVSHRCYEGAIHGCLSLAGVLAPGRAMLDDCTGALRAAFSRVTG